MIATHEIGPYRIRVIHSGRAKWMATVSVGKGKSEGWCVYTNGSPVQESTKEKLLSYLEYAHGQKAFEIGCKCRRCRAENNSLSP